MKPAAVAPAQPAGNATTARELRCVLIGRGLRAFADGYVAVLLPAYLIALGFGQFEVGVISTATLAGSAAATLMLGAIGHRWAPRRLLLGAALLMAVPHSNESNCAISRLYLSIPTGISAA